MQDGTPLDLNPKLTMDGVVFSFLDTSSSETQVCTYIIVNFFLIMSHCLYPLYVLAQFTFFVGAQNSELKNKHKVDEMSTQSMDCGRISQMFAHVDTNVVNDVGDVKEYAIRASQTNVLGQSSPTDVTTIAYRIPFLVDVSGYVKTASGTGKLFWKTLGVSVVI